MTATVLVLEIYALNFAPIVNLVLPDTILKARFIGEIVVELLFFKELIGYAWTDTLDILVLFHSGGQMMQLKLSLSRFLLPEMHFILDRLEDLLGWIVCYSSHLLLSLNLA